MKGNFITTNLILCLLLISPNLWANNSAINKCSNLFNTATEYERLIVLNKHPRKTIKKSGISASDLFPRNNNSKFVFETKVQDLVSVDSLDLKSPTFSLDIAHGIVDRFNSQYLKTINGRATRTTDIDLKGNTEILIFFPAQATEGIIRIGFQNYHQTGQTMAASGRSRSEEENIIGLKLPRLQQFDEVYPKSAYLNTQAPKDIGSGNVELHKSYGGVAARLKEEVKDRSLISNDDSMVITLNLKYPRVFHHLNSFQHKEISIESTTVHDHIEVLVYGSLNITNIDYFLVHKEQVGPKLLQLLESTGKPVFEMKVERKFDRYIYSKGQPLFYELE